ncbi:MAG: NifB/NifX family molybdenum-iron cluster-binding protein [Deltaproteobacteria bacterium]|nr:NifB/NifX family molybdenum-iron cluster-binding protein [Deltaproteobacteria bacterium]MBW2619940.1 NifB/NifX family molybdenum-iron cluster-binding protein [Deltaproteobacteria bacterium]MBW2642577.1 NifB/NifX family molybdenum-iron cluster-binding protein [Deltaproteobacteria bacterium]
MKVAISSSGKDLNSQVDPRFGRCAYFLIINTEDMSFEAFDNESGMLGGGAGIQSAQFIASKGAKAVITGNCGPNAVNTLYAAGIQVFLGNMGTVTEALDNYKNGNLTPTKTANVLDHNGIAAGTGMGGGRGMGGGGRGRGGRGMGGGGGMGMGGGGGTGRGKKMS